MYVLLDDLNWVSLHFAWRLVHIISDVQYFRYVFTIVIQNFILWYDIKFLYRDMLIMYLIAKLIVLLTHYML